MAEGFSWSVLRGAGPVARAQEAWEADPSDRNLLELAVACYSFRSSRRYASMLLSLRGSLRDLAYREMGAAGRSEDVLKRANQADMLATYFEWMSRQESLPVRQREQLSELAGMVCEWCLSWFRAFSLGSRGYHTYALLKLTEARILLEKGDCVGVLKGLKVVSRIAPSIDDANQRARVYRKLGFLWRKNGRWFRGFWWGVRAIFVSGPLAVKIKSFVALVGIDL